MLPRNRLLSDNLDHYNMMFVTFYPMLMRPSQLQRAMLKGYERFFSAGRILGKLRERDYERAQTLTFAAWKQHALLEKIRAHIPLLEEKERGHYDSNDRLIESSLGPPPAVFRAPSPGIYERPAERALQRGLPRRAPLHAPEPRGKQRSLTVIS
jgi:hypothetical protein